PQALELPADLVSLLARGGLGERRLRVLEPLVQIVLPTGQLAQPVEHLPRLAVLRGLPLRRPLRLVAVLFAGQLELPKLLALLLRPGRRAAGTRGLPAL